MRSFRILLQSLPWLLVVGLLIYVMSSKLSGDDKTKEVAVSTVILQEVEQLGKLELVKYNFKEITEINKKAPEYFYNLIKIGSDSKMALISAGSAVGCIDLSKMKESDLRVAMDTLYVRLPYPELCYHKVDLENTKIYHLETNLLVDEKAFIEEGYKTAERQIKNAALQSGILKQTYENAELFLRPLFEKISGKIVVFSKLPDSIPLNKDFD